MKSIKLIITFFVAVVAANVAGAQCEMEIDKCNVNITDDFISDGQIYSAFLDGDQVAEFDITLFGGSTYRISGCSGDTEGNLLFRLLDENGEVLFSNKEYSNSSYWDFTLDSTLNCTIEAQLDSNKKDSGCGVIMIGFKK